MKTVPLSHAAEIRLGRQRAPEYETGEGQTLYLRSANIQDGTLNLVDVKAMRFSAAEREVYGLRPGDVLVTEGSGSRDTVGASAVWQGEIAEPVCFQNTLLRLRPRPEVIDGRYLAWWARHVHAAGLVAAASTGANILHIGAETLRALPIRVPDLLQQRRIADFLDAQVGCLSGLIAEHAKALALLEERASSMVMQSTRRSETSPLKRHLLKQARPVETGHVEMITAFRDGQVVARALRRPDGFTDSWTDGAQVQGVVVGDVVIHGLDGFSGAIGASESDGVCSPANHVCVPLQGGDPDFYARLLRSLALSGYLSLYGGSARERAVDFRNWQKFSGIPLPIVPLDEQHQIGDLVRGIRPIRQEIARLTALCEERKRALITACISGDFDVSTASSLAAQAALQGVS